jgi:hypothetical protein
MKYGSAIKLKTELRTWLCKHYFKDDHLKRYENKPIYFPLSSSKKTFVAFISIHRWNADTLRILLASHLQPERKSLAGQQADLRTSRAGTSGKELNAIEKQLALVDKHLLELDAFIKDIEQCAERGPLPPDNKVPAREVDARYDPDLDDGVMINSAALYPLLTPQWKKPLAWWKELAAAKGRKDYDWSHLAQRYFPARVEAKCVKDPSLGVAHGCFWRLHPERAWAWELRLGQEIGPDFTIDEHDADEHRAAFLLKHPVQAIAAVEKEAKRRKRKKLDTDVSHPVGGMWENHAAAVVAMEKRMTDKFERAWVYSEPGCEPHRPEKAASSPSPAGDLFNRSGT